MFDLYFTACYVEHLGTDGTSCCGCVDIVINPGTERALLLCNECGADLGRGIKRDGEMARVPADSLDFFNAKDKQI